MGFPMLCHLPLFPPIPPLNILFTRNLPIWISFPIPWWQLEHAPTGWLLVEVLTKGSLVTLVGAVCWADELLGYSYGERGRGRQDMVLGGFRKDVSVGFGDHETKFVANEVINGAEESRGCISKCAERQVDIE